MVSPRRRPHHGQSTNNTQSNPQLKITLTPAQKHQIKQAFDLFDSDGSEAIACDELKVAMRAIGQDMNADEIKKLVQQTQQSHHNNATTTTTKNQNTQSSKHQHQQQTTSNDAQSQQQQRTIDFSDFLTLLTSRMTAPDSIESLHQSFSLFDKASPPQSVNNASNDGTNSTSQQQQQYSNSGEPSGQIMKMIDVMIR
jgi:centrin-1